MEQIPFPSFSRLEGIIEQSERAKLFLAEAKKSQNRLDKFRRLVASVYFSRAVAELMLEAADKQEVSKNRQDIEAILLQKLPYYRLVERLRIHDFHRFGLRFGLLDDEVLLLGPIKLIARGKGGAAAIRVTPQGLKKTVTGGSQIDEQRPLLLSGDRVFDEEQGQYVSIEQVVSKYLDAAPTAIKEFENLMAPT